MEESSDLKAALRTPSAFLRSRVNATCSTLTLAKHLSLRSVPTRGCDVVVLAAASTTPETLTWLLSTVIERAPNLSLTRIKHVSQRARGFYVSASYESLLRCAEKIQMRKHLKPEHGGMKKEFSCAEAEYFQGCTPSGSDSNSPDSTEEKLRFFDSAVETSSAFFTSQERQALVCHMLNNIRLDSTETICDDQLLVVKGQAIIPFLLNNGILSQMLPLHEEYFLQELKDEWVFAFTKPQPMEKVKEYFGVSIAMYFAFLGYYTKALFIPALIGVYLYIYSGANQTNLLLKDSDDTSLVLFAILNVIWATVFVKMWRRECAEKAYQWGTIDKQSSLISEPRPLFHGTLSNSLVTGRLEPSYPQWRRNMTFYCVSVPLIFVSLVCVLLHSVLLLELQDWFNELVKDGYLWRPFKGLPMVLLGLTVMVMNSCYQRLARWLNDLENYRLEEEYKNQMIIKLVIFQSVNAYLSLFYTAFYHQDLDRLQQQLAALLIVRQIVGNMKESLLSLAIAKFNLYKTLHQTRDLFSPLMSPSPSLSSPLSSQSPPLSSQSPPLSSQSPPLSSQFPPLSSPFPSLSSPSPPLSSQSPPLSSPSLPSAQLPKQEHMEADYLQVPPACDKVTSDGQEEAVSPPDNPARNTRNGCSAPREWFSGRPQSKTMAQAEMESSLPRYEDTYEDYLEMVIQFGYVAWFSCVFPLAGLAALLNNVVEIRSDAFKLCMGHQRPFGEQVRDIGVWQNVMEAMAVGAIVVNTALIGVSGQIQRLLPHFSNWDCLLLMGICEHVIFGLTYFLYVAIEDVPHWISVETARLEFNRREALKKLECVHSSPSPDQPDIPSSHSIPDDPEEDVWTSPVIESPLDILPLESPPNTASPEPMSEEGGKEVPNFPVNMLFKRR